MLANAEKIHEKLGLSLEIMVAFRTFLLMVTCPYVMDPEKFGLYCGYVDKLMRDEVGWHPSIPRLNHHH